MTIFINPILKSSLYASIVFLFLYIIRLLLFKVPSKYKHFLMLGVFASLLFSPFISSSVSAINLVETAANNNDLSHMIRLLSEKNIVNIVYSLEKTYYITLIFLTIWIIGIVILILITIKDLISTKKRLRFAMKIKDNVYECEEISSPFVLGVISPKIYIPVNLNEDEYSILVFHEKTHVKYFDYLFKPVCLLLLIIHWFNPFIWIAYYIFNKDCEFACDEISIDSLKDKELYLKTLVKMSSFNAPSFVSFEGGNTKTRVKKLIDYKPKENAIVMRLSILLSAVVCAFFIISYKTEAKILNDNEIFLNLPVDNIQVVCGYSCYYGHNTVDFIDRFNKNGDVFALYDGTVESVGYDNVNGNYIYLLHKNGYRSFYNHLEKIYVKVGDSITNEPIGKIGNTGNVTAGNHVGVALFDEDGKYIENLEELLVD